MIEFTPIHITLLFQQTSLLTLIIQTLSATLIHVHLTTIHISQQALMIQNSWLNRRAVQNRLASVLVIIN